MKTDVDASPFAWLGGRVKYTLHGAVDDATGQVTALFICKNECLFGYLEMLRRTIHDFGLPVSLYSDRHSIFRSPVADKISIEEQLAGVTANDTQFGRTVSELGITLIPARSPQAKGRIERLWETLQSRLPFDVVRFIKPKNTATAPKQEKLKNQKSPDANHPWRNSLTHKISLEELDQESLAILSQIFQKGYA